MKKQGLLIWLLFISISISSQNKSIENFLLLIRNSDFDRANDVLKNTQTKDTLLLNCLAYFLKVSKSKGIYNETLEKVKPKEFNKKNMPVFYKSISYLNAGLYQFYYENNSDSKVMTNYLQALELAKSDGPTPLTSIIYCNILEYYSSIIKKEFKSFKTFTSEYKSNSFDSIDLAIADYYDLSIPIGISEYEISSDEYAQLIEVGAKLKNTSYTNDINILKGIYLENNGFLSKAKHFYASAIQNNEDLNSGHQIISYLRAKLNLGVLEYKSQNYDSAFKILKDSIAYDGKPIFSYKIRTDFWLSRIYFKKKKFDSAYIYLNKSRLNHFSLNQTNYLSAVRDIQEKYQTAEKEKQLLIEQQKRKQNRNLLIGAIAFILFGSITAFLLQKNTRKKQKLAEQEKSLESQKLATVLKEQELVSIDAMIEGQEKERQRIADDLHDDLGGLMATVKLHFNALKDKQTPELFDRTTTLLDDAYQKIRSIAHAKNSGVIAKQGLLIAVQNMADKISASNKITVKVIDHGLDQRLENSLELTIFRVIQELITNVIKHAEATESTIHLTNHDETLNIMVEDNGKGFNPSQVTTKNKGMGISSIDKRIEHLNGSMTIESDPGTGTTIIIDIPI
ncbi:sensor histidine kinase [Hyunsoonleella sp. SJ7]|uniref:Oxygen sensor histidine kinase NreB n=1 Tax=Hyunsoonleella aquatilis TaxID=2762758 RepID=A0A923HBK0_9FLAO|nr:sensor histidine kinase [Hyunsoonleella aquatilis]MBC3758817.1 sensor histidine kinase [Hyunsoonleella aquatilis]